MYRVFESIPQEVRQQAFDEYVKSRRKMNYEDNLRRTALGLPPTKENRTRSWSGSYEHGGMCCPLGAVCVELGLGRVVSPVEVRVPNGGAAVRKLLAHADILVDPTDAQEFISDNDHECFDTFQKLAKAMGVEYHQEEDHV